MAVKQTAGRDALGKFAPKFAELNDDVLFGQVWSREDKLSLRDRSIVTVVALMAQGLTDSSFQYHLTTAKNNGVTKTEIAEILTHSAFMRAGQRHGRPSVWQRRYGRRTMPPTQKPNTRTRWYFLLAHPMTPLRNILSDKAISHLYLRSRSVFTM